MILKQLFIISLFGAICIRPSFAITNDDKGNLHNNVVVIGNIESSKFLNTNDNELIPTAQYIVNVKVRKKLSADNFDLKRFSTEIGVTDIKELMKNSYLFVLKKNRKSWRVVRYEQISDVICLDEKSIEREGWKDYTFQSLNVNCFDLGYYNKNPVD